MIEKLLDKKILGSVLVLIVVVTFFIVATVLAQKYENELQSFVGQKGISVGMVSYVLITAFAIVIAPVSTLPLIPVAVGVWGWVATGILSVIGWVIGSQIAFHLARSLGKPFIQKIVSLERLEKFEKHFSEKNLFWIVVFLRMTVPVDILSYAVGLFSRMRSASYFLATLIGVIPFAFVFSYAGALPISSQIITLIEVMAFIIIVSILRRAITHQKI